MTMIGIDPHKQSHTAVAIDGDEVVLGEFADVVNDLVARRRGVPT